VAAVPDLIRLGRHLGTASLAGVLAGIVVGGFLGRVAMRVSGFMSRPELVGVETSNGNRVGDITFEGTLALVVFAGVASGTVGGLLYASAEPWLRSSRGRGLIFGTGVLLALGYTTIEPSNVDFEQFGVGSVNVLMFTLLFVAFGVAIAFAFDGVRRIIEGPGVLGTLTEILAWITALISVLIGSLTLVGIGIGGGGLPIAFWVGLALAVPPIVLWLRLPRAVGYAAFALPMIVGGTKLLNGLPFLID
jgi:hypothetical protein